MKINKTLTALIASASIGFSGQALAAAETDDTAAGTTISNTASFSYTIGGAAAVEADSTAVTFIVDTKVDLTLAWNDASYVTADVGDDIVLKLLLSNEGNSVQTFKFDTAESVNTTTLPALTADDADTSEAWTYYQDDGDDAYQGSGTDTLLTGGVISNLAIDTDGSNIVTIWAVGKNLDTTADESEIGVEIRARAWDGAAYLTEGNTNGSGTAIKNTSLDDEFIVFAEDPDGDKALTLAGAYTVDGTRDGGFVVLTEILVAAPIISIEKSVSVIASPFTLSDGSFVAIPGSTIEYEITVINDGTGGVSDLAVTDILDFSNYDLSGTAGSASVDFFLADGTTPATDPGNTSTNQVLNVGTGSYTIDLDLVGKREAKITLEVVLN